MLNNQDFGIKGNRFYFKSDTYKLDRIRSARARENSYQSQLVRVLVIGALFSSIVWVICPGGFASILAPVAMVVGVIFALFTAKRYELQVKFAHIDETGEQWVSVAKSNKQADMALFEQQVDLLKAQ